MSKTRGGRKRKFAARFGFTKKAILIAVVVLGISLTAAFGLATYANSLKFGADSLCTKFDDGKGTTLQIAVTIGGNEVSSGTTAQTAKIKGFVVNNQPNAKFAQIEIDDDKTVIDHETIYNDKTLNNVLGAGVDYDLSKLKTGQHTIIIILTDTDNKMFIVNSKPYKTECKFTVNPSTPAKTTAPVTPAATSGGTGTISTCGVGPNAACTGVGAKVTSPNQISFPSAVATFLKIPGSNIGGTVGFKDYVAALIKFATYLGGILATLMIMYAGFIYLTSSGDSSKLNSAKEVLLGSILGFIMLLCINEIDKFIHVVT